LAATITKGLSQPGFIHLDAAGNLWVVDNSANNVVMYAPPFSSASAPALTLSGSGIYYPGDAAIDRHGRLFVANYGGSVTIYQPPFVGSSNGLVTTLSSGISNHVNSVFIGPSGNLWITNGAISGPDNVEEYAAPFSDSSAPALTLTSGLGYPDNAVLDAASNVYVSDSDNNRISVFTPPFQGSSQGFDFAITDGENFYPYQMAFDSVGDLFVGTYANGILEYAPPFSSSSTPVLSITNGTDYPTGVAVQPGQPGCAPPHKRSLEGCALRHR
jgi:sugar lactone lactonase YvrE